MSGEHMSALLSSKIQIEITGSDDSFSLWVLKRCSISREQTGDNSSVSLKTKIAP